MIPKGLKPEDEYLHPAPPGHTGLWGDTIWLSVVDPKANVFGIIHFHATVRGYCRFESLFIIDGVYQLYGNKYMYDREAVTNKLSDGVLTYEVVEPFKTFRTTFDSPRYGYDLVFTGRFPAFDYEDCIGGNPLKKMHRTNSDEGGHLEQGMACKGRFEIRGGPSKGDVRQIDCWSHRDHTWSDRFTPEIDWEYEHVDMMGHFWPSVQLPDRHINIFGLIDPALLAEYFPGDKVPVGGFESTAEGSRPLRNGTAQVEKPLEGHPRLFTSFKYEFEMPDGDIIHVKNTAYHGTVKLWLRAENDLENRLDCFEPFLEWEVEETGERGTGVGEYSVIPPWPRWLV
jgi:hypothetical protein